MALAGGPGLQHAHCAHSFQGGRDKLKYLLAQLASHYLPGPGSKVNSLVGSRQFVFAVLMEPLEPLDGGWLAAPGKYQDLVRDLCASDPRLRQPEKLPFLRWAHRQARVIVFELHEYSDARVPRVFTDMRELDEELKKRGKGPNERPEKMLYIVENANQSLVDIMGRHFELHPSMFLEYARTTQTPRYNKGHSSLLASALATRDYLWFNYYELVLLPDELQGNSYRLRCSETGRSVRTTRVRGVFDRAGLAFHKCFFWSKPRASGSGWDCEWL